MIDSSSQLITCELVGVLPCAGEGLRWGGVHKELVPIGHQRWLVDGAVDSMVQAGVRGFCVVTDTRKVGVLADHFSKSRYDGVDIAYLIQRGPESMKKTAMML